MSLDFNEIINLSVCFGSFYGFYKLFRLAYKPKLREIDTELLNRLDRIYYLKQQYVKTQELLWDMDLTNPNELKGIELEWQSA